MSFTPPPYRLIKLFSYSMVSARNLNLVLLSLLCLSVVSFSLPIPEVQAKLLSAVDPADPSNILPDLNWNWCENTDFDDLGLVSPWNSDDARRGVNLAQFANCESWKSGWELYDRRLDLGDRDHRLLARTVGAPDERPYFALYNRFTGVLRVFLYVEKAANEGDFFVVRLKVTQGADEIVSNHLLDFLADGAFPSLAIPGQNIQKTWLLPNPTDKVWLILDIPMTYDPSDFPSQDGFERQIFMQFDVQIQDQSDFNMSGSLSAVITTETVQQGNLLSSLMGAGSDAVATYSNSTKLATDLKAGLQSGKFDVLSPENVARMTAFANALSGGGNVAAAVVSGGFSLFNRLNADQTSTTTSHLEGTLKLSGTADNFVTNRTYSIPYSGAIRSELPLYAYRYQDPAMRKLGLFHLSRWTYELEPARWNHGGEAASCRVLMNPNTTTKPYKEKFEISTENPLLQSIGLLFSDQQDPQNPAKQSVWAFQAGVSIVPNYVMRTTSVKDYPWIGQDGSVCLEGGLYQSEIISDWHFPEYFTIGAVQMAKLNDRVRVNDPAMPSGYGNIYGLSKHLASYQPTVELGADAVAGEIWGAKVTLRERALLTERLLSDQVEKQNQVVIRGGTFSLPSSQMPLPVGQTVAYFAEQHSGIVDDPLEYYPGLYVSWDGCVATSSTANPSFVKNCSMVGATRVLHLSPGTYRDVLVHPGARLELEPGDYIIRNLVLESGAQFSQKMPSQATRVFLTGALTWRASLVANSVNPAKLLVANLSDQWNTMTTPFWGTFIAPGGRLIVGSGRDEEYKGRFYANYLEVHQTTRITKVLFQNRTNP